MGDIASPRRLRVVRRVDGREIELDRDAARIREEHLAQAERAYARARGRYVLAFEPLAYSNMPMLNDTRSDRSSAGCRDSYPSCDRIHVAFRGGLRPKWAVVVEWTADGTPPFGGGSVFQRRNKTVSPSACNDVPEPKPRTPKFIFSKQ